MLEQRNQSKRRAHARYEKALAMAQSKSPDWERIVGELNSSMEGGSEHAAYALSTWHLFGKEPYIRKNVRKAVELLELAAAAGLPAALYDLAVCYQKGEGVRKSPRKAFDFYLAAALRDDADALVEVARCLQHGLGVRRDRRTAAVFIERARDLGAKLG